MRSTEDKAIASKGSQFMAWLSLLRLSNLPTVFSNILMGYLLAHGSWTPVWPLMFLLAATAGLYLGGMVLNDYFDVEQDSLERPGRPIPSGAISKSQARNAGTGLILFGVIAAVMAGVLAQTDSGFQIARTTTFALSIAMLVYLYDGPLKRSMLAPWLMGGCRFFNVLLGGATVAGASFFGSMPNIFWWIAASIGILIAGTTLLGRNEAAKSQNSGQIYFGAAMIFLGLIGLATSCFCPEPGFDISVLQKKTFPIFVAIIAFPIFRSTMTAAIRKTPGTIQAGIITVLRSLIILDGLVCYLAAGYHPGYAIAVVCLIIPKLVLGRKIAST